MGGKYQKCRNTHSQIVCNILRNLPLKMGQIASKGSEDGKERSKLNKLSPADFLFSECIFNREKLTV